MPKIGPVPIKRPQSLSRYGFIGLASLVALLAWGLLAFVWPVHAQGTVLVQELTGTLDLGGEVFYRLPNLRAGDTLYVHVSRTSGNLDPWVALADTNLEAERLSEALSLQVAQVIAQGQDPLQALPRIYDQFFNSILFNFLDNRQDYKFI